MASPLKIAMVQYEVQPRRYESVRAFENSIEPIVLILREEHPDIVIFPEHIGTFLMVSGQPLDGIESIHSAILGILMRQPRLLLRVILEKWRRKENTARALGWARLQPLVETLVNIFQGVARRLNAFVVAGSFPTAFEDKLCHATWVFAPDGDVVVRVGKVNLIDEERPLFDMAPRDSIEPFDVKGKRIGVLVCLDAFHPELAELLYQRGARALIVPRANSRLWTLEEEQRSRDGVYARLQEHPGWQWGCEVFLVGELLGDVYQGRSRAFIREQFEPIAQAGTCNREDVVVFEVS